MVLVLQNRLQSQRSQMLHISSLWETAAIDSGSDLPKNLHRYRRGRWGTTVIGAGFISNIDLLGIILRHKMAMALDDSLLGIEIHLGGDDDDAAWLYFGVQKCMRNTEIKSEMWEGVGRSEHVVMVFSTTF